jgi:hypothetical protein
LKICPFYSGRNFYEDFNFNFDVKKPLFLHDDTVQAHTNLQFLLKTLSRLKHKKEKMFIGRIDGKKLITILRIEKTVFSIPKLKFLGKYALVSDTVAQPLVQYFY